MGPMQNGQTQTSQLTQTGDRPAGPFAYKAPVFAVAPMMDWTDFRAG